MKKTLIIFLVILVGLFIILWALGRGGEYGAEKAMWKITREFSQAARDPETIPDATFNRIFRNFQQFSKKFSKSKLSPYAEILSGQVLVLNKKYKEARDIFEGVAKKYAHDSEIAVKAIKEIGRTYALEQNSDGIMSTYKRIIRDYPKSEDGLRIPLLIAQFHMGRKEMMTADEAFKDAIIYYRKMIDENPNSFVEFSSLHLIAVCYISQKDWERAVQSLSDALLKYPDPKYWQPQKLMTLTQSINTISVVQLHDFDLAINTYQQFMTKYPSHPFNQIFEKMVQGLSALKEKTETAAPAAASPDAS